MNKFLNILGPQVPHLYFGIDVKLKALVHKIFSIYSYEGRMVRMKDTMERIKENKLLSYYSGMCFAACGRSFI